MNKVIDKGFRSCRFVSTIVKHPVFYNENHGQRKRYKRHIANVSITPVVIISALQIDFFGRDFHYKAIQQFCFPCTIVFLHDWTQSLFQSYSNRGQTMRSVA